MDSFICVTCFFIALLSGSGGVFFLWGEVVCILDGRWRDAAEAAFIVLLFSVLFIISAPRGATVRRLEEMELIFCSTDLIKRKVWAITEKGRRALKEIGI